MRTHANFHSKILNNDRNLYVYLPPGYDKNTDQHYAVLYMQDGQNLFDAALNPAGEWKADEAAQWLIPRHKIQPLIIVGISNNAQRLDEYTLSRDERMKAGGNGEAYIRFVCEEVKPFIDATYRTQNDRAHTGVGGSSLGATIALEMCREHPETFGRCAMVSPALWWNNWDLPKRVQNDLKWTAGCKVWIDIGTAEVPPAQSNAYVAMVRRVADVLVGAGMKEGTDLRFTIVPGGIHSESAWAARFDKVLMFLFPPEL